MKSLKKSLVIVSLTAINFWSLTAFARSVYINGVDVSQAKNQSLKNVNLKIDENGNIFIDAPHYQVHEESSYTPLSQYIQGSTGPVHAPAQNLPLELEPLAGAEKLPPVDVDATTPPKTPPQSGKTDAAASGGATGTNQQQQPAGKSDAPQTALQEKAGSKG